MTAWAELRGRVEALEDAASLVMSGYRGEGHCAACDMMALKAADLLLLADHARLLIPPRHQGRDRRTLRMIVSKHAEVEIAGE